MSTIVLPLPNDEYDDGIVIASVWQNDDDNYEPITAVLMLLRREPPYYSVCDIEWQPHTRSWVNVIETQYPNINPATAGYAEHGGDY